MTDRQFSRLDRILAGADQALRIATANAPPPERENPAGDLPPAELSESERRHVAGLMRINHTGEICAQALYAGQAAAARSAAVRHEMQQAADEEIDHLAWCEARLKELDSQPSYLNGLWYAGSWALGAAAGLAGDDWSLGFVKETENQVEAHLEEHRGRLPESDRRSHAILEQMKIDEAQHAAMAEAAGARELPQAVRAAMRFSSNLMKTIVYRF